MSDNPHLPAGIWIVLGLLVEGRKKRSGYELQALATRSVAHFWPITKAHIYTALAKLEELELVISEKVAQVGVPDKRTYSPTGKGRKAFEIWLAEEDLGEPKMRHPLLIKIFFGDSLAPSKVGELLDLYNGRTVSMLERYEVLLSRLPSKPKLISQWRRFAIMHGISRLKADLEWILDVRSML